MPPPYDLTSLVSNPQFQALPPDRKRAMLGVAGASPAFIDQFVGGEEVQSAPPPAAAGEHFVRGFVNTTVPSLDFGKRALKAAVYPVGTVSAEGDWEAPESFKLAWDVAKGAVSAHFEQLRKAAEAAREGDGMAMLGHGVAGMVPFVGPPAADAVEKMREGDFATGAGELTGLVAPLVLPSKLPGAGRVGTRLANRAESGVSQNMVRALDATAKEVPEVAKNAALLSDRLGVGSPETLLNRLKGEGADTLTRGAVNYNEPLMQALERAGVTATSEIPALRFIAARDLNEATQALEALGIPKSHPHFLSLLEAKRAQPTFGVARAELNRAKVALGGKMEEGIDVIPVVDAIRARKPVTHSDAAWNPEAWNPGANVESFDPKMNAALEREAARLERLQQNNYPGREGVPARELFEVRSQMGTEASRRRGFDPVTGRTPSAGSEASRIAYGELSKELHRLSPDLKAADLEVSALIDAGELLERQIARGRTAPVGGKLRGVLNSAGPTAAGALGGLLGFTAGGGGGAVAGAAITGLGVKAAFNIWDSPWFQSLSASQRLKFARDLRNGNFARAVNTIHITGSGVAPALSRAEERGSGLDAPQPPPPARESRVDPASVAPSAPLDRLRGLAEDDAAALGESPTAPEGTTPELRSALGKTRAGQLLRDRIDAVNARPEPVSLVRAAGQAADKFGLRVGDRVWYTSDDTGSVVAWYPSQQAAAAATKGRPDLSVRWVRSLGSGK